MANDKKALLPLIVALVASLMCFCSPLPAFADDVADDSPAYEVWQQYKDSSVSEFGLYKQVAEDLAYRWFMADETKRAKVPLQSKALGSYKQLSQYAEDYDTPDQQWQAFYDDFHPSFMVRMYSLVTYEDSLATWSVSDNYAYQHFKEWYEHFEGAYAGGSGETEGGTGYYDPSTGETRMVTTYNKYYVNANYNGTKVNVYNGTYNIDNPCYATLVEGTVTLNKDSSFVDNGYDYMVTYEPHTLNVWLVPHDSCEPVYELDDYGNQRLIGLRNVTDGKITLKNYPQWNTYLDVSGNSGLVNATIDVTARLSGFGYGHDVSSGGIYSYTNVSYWSYGTTEGGGGESSDTPIYPGTPEPETPEQPTPSNPVFIDNDTTTTTVDLEPILEAIRRLNSNVITGFDTLNDNMNAWLENLSDWLKTIWEDLRSTNQWLERIFFKTSGGGSSDEPDIIIDGDGWWSWLGTIASMLLGDLAGAVSGLGGAFDALHGLFPFSIPWDVAALLGLFVSDPVTPVFDVPLPYGFADGAAQMATVHVDLTSWNGVMSAVRSVELAIFALGLALKTRDMLRNTEVEQ